MAQKKLLQEIRDQLLHFLYGLLATAAIGMFLPLYVALPVVLLLALVREKRQHPDRSFFKLVNLDVLVVLAGQAVAIGLLFLIN